MDFAAFKVAMRDIIVSLLGRPATPVVSTETVDGTADENGGWTALASTTLTFNIDGDSYSVTFGVSTFTVAEAIADIEAVITGVAYAVGTYGSERLKLGLRSIKKGGTDSRIQVTGGGANAVLLFSTTETVGTGIADNMVGWVDEKQPHVMFGEATRINLDIVALRKLGRDNRQHEFTGGNVELTLVGPRIVTVQIQAEAFTHDGAKFGFARLDKILDRIHLNETEERFRAAGIALVTTGEAVKLPTREINDRTYSWSNLDIQVSYMNETVDDTIAGGDYIETAEITSPFLPPPPNPITVTTV